LHFTGSIPRFPPERVSIGKARTAALLQPTKNFEDVITQKGRTSMIALDDFTPLQGGVPIVVGGQIVGAIGVSGASSADQDEQFAKVSAAALK
jgi:glc operon protein GlcG